MTNVQAINENFLKMRERIRRAERGAGKKEGSTALMAVTKMQDDTALDAALVSGQRLFGENKVQEAVSHWTQRRAGYPDLRLHMIGPLQTNKVQDAVALFDCIETLDREKLALALSREIQRSGKSPSILIQVNTGEEPQKAGVTPEALSEFIGFCQGQCGLAIDGLMCIPPADEPAALHFALLVKLARRHRLTTLSMGMSNDFEKAVALGASHIRVGSALFGERQ